MNPDTCFGDVKPVVRWRDGWWLAWWGYYEDGPDDPMRPDPRVRSFHAGRFDTWQGAHAALARRIRRGWVIRDVWTP